MGMADAQSGVTMLRLVPLPVPLAVGVRDSVPGMRTVADEGDAFPCRRCLRDAEVGDELVLVSYDPFEAGATSPYRQSGPIYVHAGGCAPREEDLSRAPRQLTRRRLSVRAFDDSHLMVAAEVIDGESVELVAERLLADPRVRYLHVHNAAPGCFAVRIDGGR
jgi:hypothetical protein